jgi:hypothetical protein
MLFAFPAFEFGNRVGGKQVLKGREEELIPVLRACLQLLKEFDRLRMDGDACKAILRTTHVLYMKSMDIA